MTSAATWLCPECSAVNPVATQKCDCGCKRRKVDINLRVGRLRKLRDPDADIRLALGTSAYDEE